MILSFLISLMGLHAAPAFEVTDASVVCDRFIGGPERDQCVKFVKDKKPDTYVSSVCHYLFDDKVFNECLKLATRVSVNPKELSFCDGADMADTERLNCIKNRSRAGKEFQRVPASFSKGKKTEASKPAVSSSGTKVYPESKADSSAE